jgi:hypothetical protein
LWKRGDAKRDPEETAAERVAAAWVELRKWRSFVAPAFKHVFSQVHPPPTFPYGPPIDASKWTKETEGDDEDEEKQEPATLHACATQSDVPFQVPLRLLALGADPNELSVVQRASITGGLLSEPLSVLASAVYHRSATTQIALLTCSRVTLHNAGANTQWYFDGYFAHCSEYQAAWPTREENHMTGKKQSMWWRDNLDAAFRYILLAREYYVQLASGYAMTRSDPASQAITTREWNKKAADVFECNTSLLALVGDQLGQLHPNVLKLVSLLLTEGVDAATEYAYDKRRPVEQLNGVFLAKEILQSVKVRRQTTNARCGAAAKLSKRWLT